MQQVFKNRYLLRKINFPASQMNKIDIDLNVNQILVEAYIVQTG